MSDADNAFPGFGKLVPGFDFLQTLAKQAAGSASQSLPQMPNLANWIAPTLNVEELDKRIQELKSVQFWLDQNATALKATVQALEVQKMTLATLKGMNFNMGDVANAFKLKVADKARTFAGLEVPPSAFQASAASADEAREDTDDDQEDAEEARLPSKPPTSSRAPRSAKTAKADAAAPAGVVDPMQWWGALTQQFQTIAADAMKDVAKQTAVNATKGLAKDAVKTATGMARGVAKGMADSAGKTMAGGARAMTSALRSTQAWPTPGAAAPKARPKVAAKKTPARKAARKTSR